MASYSLVSFTPQLPLYTHKFSSTRRQVGKICSSFVSPLNSRRNPSRRAATATFISFSTVSSELQSLSSTESLPIFNEEGSVASFPASAGIYAIFDREGELQYIGLSRKVSTTIEGHASGNPDLCGSVKVAVVAAPSREALQEAWKSWVTEYVESSGKVPPGNEKGSTVWTEKRVKRVKPDLKLTPGAHVTLTIPLIELVDKVVKGTKVVAFIKGSRSAPECGFSHRVLTILNEAGADYDTINVLDTEHNANIREVIKEYSQWPTIPQLYVKGEFVGGADIVDEMSTSGELKKLLLS